MNIKDRKTANPFIRKKIAYPKPRPHIALPSLHGNPHERKFKFLYFPSSLKFPSKKIPTWEACEMMIIIILCHR